MPPVPHIRRSRRLSHRLPTQAADCPHLEITHLSSPSPSTCTTTSDASPPIIITHLPFAPGSSHTRNRKEGHIPRPPNAFMVFRSWLWNKDNLKNIERDNRNVSRIAGRYWNELSEAERAPFRAMAEEAKARHTQLYPQYRYSPASQKKPKVAQRRSQRAADIENEKCDRVVDMLLANVDSRNMPKPTGEEYNQVQPSQRVFAHAAEEMSSDPSSVIPRNAVRRPVVPYPPQPRSKTFSPSPLISTQCAPSFSILPAAEDSSEMTPTPGPVTRTPDLVFPPAEEFIPTDEIPYLSLDTRNDLTVKTSDDNDFSALFPSHMEPAIHTVFAGVKPEASTFVDSCMFSAYNADALVQSIHLPFTNFDIDPYSSLDSALVPLGSPVFSNPFDPSIPATEHSVLLDSLDQLFGQPISPLNTTFFPTENW